MYISFTVMLLFAAAIIVKAATIQFRDGDKLRAMAEKVHIRHQQLPAERGNIYSEDGTLLCSTIPQFDFHVDFGVINKDTFYHYVDSLSVCLSRLFGDASASAYRRRLIHAFSRGYRYWSLKDDAGYQAYAQIRKFPIFDKGQNIGGLIVDPHSVRIDPYGFLAHRTIGLWRENAPNIGLEAEYDSVLSGKPGYRIIRKTTGGVWMPVDGSEVDPVNGKDIVTTLDMNIQDVTEHALLKILKKYNCIYGTAIVMEVKTGKIRALANLGRAKDGTYHEDFNYALIPTEPGSTFKLFSLLSMIEDGYISVHDSINVGRGIKYFGHQRLEDDELGLGKISIEEALAHSSNVAFATLVDSFYHNDPMKYIRHLQALRLNVKTGIDIPGERRPFIKTPKDKSWNKVTSLPWIGYGYESKITPLHTCMVYNAVANNGKMMKPYLVSAIREYGKTIDSIKPTVLVKSIAKPSTLRQLKEALHAVVEYGTGHRIKSPYFNFGGKTGTAQVADRGITYSDGIRQGSFVGFFPLEHPKYTICVLARSAPHGVYYGAALGAPVFQAIADRLYATRIGGWVIPDTIALKGDRIDAKGLNGTFTPIAKAMDWQTKIPQNGQRLVDLKEVADKQFEQSSQKTAHHAIPNLEGLGLKDALDLLTDAGLNVTVVGSGKVKSQSIPAGTKIKQGEKITITLG